jgi:hypothetical protein
LTFGALNLVITAKGFRMIEFVDDREVDGLNKGEFAIIVDDDGRRKIYNALFRGTNTLSPPDKELIKLLWELK